MDSRFTRRSFLERSLSVGAIGITAAGICVCALSGCVKPDRTPVISSEWLEIRDSEIVVKVRQVEPLKRIGGSAKIVHSRLSEPIIVLRPTEGQYLAFSDKCTHRGRPLEYVHSVKELRCINFGHSVFNLDGSPVKGPAKRPLRLYKTLLLQDSLEIFI
jgi:nitrite reductase/ring-hydroxylating ferredoxin subunit